MRLSAVMVSSWRAGKLSSDRAGASASRPKSLSLDVHLDVTLRAKIHDLFGRTAFELCEDPDHHPGGSRYLRIEGRRSHPVMHACDVVGRIAGVRKVIRDARARTAESGVRP